MWWCHSPAVMMHCFMRCVQRFSFSTGLPTHNAPMPSVCMHHKSAFDCLVSAARITGLSLSQAAKRSRARQSWCDWPLQLVCVCIAKVTLVVEPCVLCLCSHASGHYLPDTPCPTGSLARAGLGWGMGGKGQNRGQRSGTQQVSGQREAERWAAPGD